MLAVVTGASGGIGKNVVEKLLARDYYVIGWVKDKVGEERLLDFLAKRNVRVHRLFIVSGDFCDNSQINMAIEEILVLIKKFKAINCFINCAGIFSDFNKQNGKDLNLKVNFSAPIYILNELKNHLSNNARLIYLVPKIGDNSLNLYGQFSVLQSYNFSNLLLIYYIRHFAQTHANFNLYLMCARTSNTDFWTKNVSKINQKIGQIKKTFSLPPEFSAEQAIFLATRPEFEGESGAMYYNLSPIPMPKQIYSKKFQSKVSVFI